MDSVAFDDFECLFDDLHTEDVGPEQCSKHEGICWFRSRAGFPQGSDIVARAGSFDVPEDQEDAFRSTLEDQLDSNIFEAFSEDEDMGEGLPERFPCEVTVAARASDGTHRYVLEPQPLHNTMLFTGQGTVEDIARIMDLVACLTNAEVCSGIDYNDLFDSGPFCRPWNFALLHAEKPAQLRSALATCLADRASAAELWAACSYGDEFGTATKILSFTAGEWDVLFDEPVDGELSALEKETYTPSCHVGIFWRDGKTDNMIPWRV